MDASPTARNSVRRIAKKLNLMSSSVSMPVLRTPLAEDEGTEVDISEAEMLSRELQVDTWTSIHVIRLYLYTWSPLIGSYRVHDRPDLEWRAGRISFAGNRWYAHSELT